LCYREGSDITNIPSKMPRRLVYGVGVWCTTAGEWPLGSNYGMTYLPNCSHCLDHRKHRSATLGTLGECRFLIFPYRAKLIALQDIGGETKYSYGLHSKCSTVTGTCEPFPTSIDCDVDATFCALWRSVGFLMSFAVIIELASWIAFAVVLLGGVQQRSYGWKMVIPLIGCAALVQVAGMSIIVCVLKTWL
jgi:hypothetical protein